MVTRNSEPHYEISYIYTIISALCLFSLYHIISIITNVYPPIDLLTIKHISNCFLIIYSYVFMFVFHKKLFCKIRVVSGMRQKWCGSSVWISGLSFSLWKWIIFPKTKLLWARQDNLLGKCTWSQTWPAFGPWTEISLKEELSSTYSQLWCPYAFIAKCVPSTLTHTQ